MLQEAAITPMHHRYAQAHKPRGPITEVVGFPAALGHALCPKEALGYLSVTRLLEPAVQRAQRQHEAVASGGGQCRGITAQRTTGQAAPEPERSRRTQVEYPVKWQQDARRLPVRSFDDVEAE